MEIGEGEAGVDLGDREEESEDPGWSPYGLKGILKCYRVHTAAVVRINIIPESLLFPS